MSLFNLLLVRFIMGIPVGIVLLLFIYFIYPEPFIINSIAMIPEEYSFKTIIDGETITQYATKYARHSSESLSILMILGTIFWVSLIYGAIQCFAKDMNKWNGNIFGILDTFTTIMDKLASNFKTTTVKTISTKNIMESEKNAVLQNNANHTETQITEKNVNTESMGLKILRFALMVWILLLIILLISSGGQCITGLPKSSPEIEAVILNDYIETQTMIYKTTFFLGIVTLLLHGADKESELTKGIFLIFIAALAGSLQIFIRCHIY